MERVKVKLIGLTLNGSYKHIAWVCCECGYRNKRGHVPKSLLAICDSCYEIVALEEQE